MKFDVSVALLVNVEVGVLELVKDVDGVADGVAPHDSDAVGVYVTDGEIDEVGVDVAEDERLGRNAETAPRAASASSSAAAWTRGEGVRRSGG